MFADPLLQTAVATTDGRVFVVDTRGMPEELVVTDVLVTRMCSVAAPGSSLAAILVMAGHFDGLLLYQVCDGLGWGSCGCGVADCKALPTSPHPPPSISMTAACGGWCWTTGYWMCVWHAWAPAAGSPVWAWC